MTKNSNILNVEVKARSYSNADLETLLQSMGAKYIGEDHQIDTYFNVPTGRLKLREGNVENSLIYYSRSNDKSARESNIVLERTNQNINLKNVLLEALGCKITVDKLRKIYFLDNVKVHFDKLANLGEFVEIEAIDHDGSIGPDLLNKQCHDLIQKFSLQQKDFIKYSYSDLIAESIKERLKREAVEFLSDVEDKLKESHINLDFCTIDHLCYRVSNEDEYFLYKNEFAKLGELLIESEVGGRNIATYKLHESIIYKKAIIDVIEVPAPKVNNRYALGFEHAEFVIAESFDDLIKEYSRLKFDVSGASKSLNPELRLSFDNGVSIKLHHQSLEEVIRIEKSMS